MINKTTVRDLISKIGGRKFLLAVIFFTVGVFLQWHGKLGMPLVTLMTTIFGVYGFTNAGVHHAHARANAKKE